MRDNETLLALRPKDAIIAMVNAENNSKFPTETFDFGVPEVVSGRITKVRLTVRDVRGNNDDVPYSGAFDFTYHRLDIGEHFSDVLAGFTPELPTSSQVLIDELTRRIGQDFFLEDLVIEDIGRSNATPYRLKAKKESLRWVGEIVVDTVSITDLSVYMLDAVPASLGRVPETKCLTDLVVNLPFQNASQSIPLFTSLQLDEPAQLSLVLQALIQRTLPRPGALLSAETTPWVTSPTPGPWNLYNARILNENFPVVHSPAVLGANPELDRAIHVQLSAEHCTNLQGIDLFIPFRQPVFDDNEFSDKPRLTKIGVVSTSNGTPWNRWLNSLTVPHVFTTLPDVVGDFLISGPLRWEVNSEIPGPTNLYNAVVQYNGVRRPQDLVPANSSLNRVMVVTLSDFNTAYRGNMSFYYRAPIVLPSTIPNALLGQPYSGPLPPTAGTPPYAMAIASGALAPGHTLDETSFQITGEASNTGTFNVGIEVVDSTNVVVRYNYTYHVTVGPLGVTGTAPSGAVGSPYSYTFGVINAVGLTNMTILSGLLPPGVVLNGSTFTLSGTPLVGGIYYVTLRLVDSRNIPLTFDVILTIA